MLNPLRALFAAPAIVGFVVLTAIVVTLLEEDKRTLAGFGSSFYWAITTVIGSGDSSYVTSPGGFIIGWLLAFFGVAIVAAMTGAVVGFVIDYLLKEGQGMGAAGYTDHIVVCGWNTTARDLIEELRGSSAHRSAEGARGQSVRYSPVDSWGDCRL